MSAFEFAKSSYSSGNGECVEVATNLVGIVGVRDSKLPEGPVVRFPANAWTNFVRHTISR
ncbi:DUF397 domain-containing protein [Streptomyces sp.]|uniref:DUF397 domain-containing protein n=1 Tax=unclassified Streptomyces TaxID=2593676 RepID=UPI002D77D126|nr:DUF397 domain-containing protein [Streptomyces sp.]HET6355111.1 DUF397 domain-containing protein [Streptomyces sp.]